MNKSLTVMASVLFAGTSLSSSLDSATLTKNRETPQPHIAFLNFLRPSPKRFRSDPQPGQSRSANQITDLFLAAFFTGNDKYSDEITFSQFPHITILASSKSNMRFKLTLDELTNDTNGYVRRYLTEFNVQAPGGLLSIRSPYPLATGVTYRWSLEELRELNGIGEDKTLELHGYVRREAHRGNSKQLLDPQYLLKQGAWYDAIYSSANASTLGVAEQNAWKALVTSIVSQDIYKNLTPEERRTIINTKPIKCCTLAATSDFKK